MTHSATELSVALAQIAPVWLNREATIEKIRDAIKQAAAQGAKLVVFGEALLPGYPLWLGLTGGAEFNSHIQKTVHAHYINNSVCIEAGELDTVTKLCGELNIACYLGLIERPAERGGKSLYCSLAYINTEGEVRSVHRKLMPTYEERLTWSPGDGHGLRVHPLGPFTVGGLNCWENWMPLPRASLYAQGEDLHIAVWPGSVRNTEDITRFIAKESRSFVVSVGAIMRPEDFPADTPHRDLILQQPEEFYTDGGSCVSAPDGQWVLAPMGPEEQVQTVVIDHQRVLEERQNFDPSGHYSRPDVTQLVVNRERQSILKTID